ncbi:MAG: CDP-alcohol phosphatidyltransferase family protein [Thermodesulfobacteriota bacterium]|nr:CDP-alcohol phosphatidyltransferase family protein [Thermodesulfobacteriota bacterium]
MISRKIGHTLDSFFYKTKKKFIKREINPDVLTLVGFFLNFIVGYLFYLGVPLWAGVLIIIAGFCDVFDGVIARCERGVTKFGGFIDSVLDRYSDLFHYIGIALFYAKQGDLTIVWVTLLAALGAVVIPYTRAKAEAIGITCQVGMMERGERLGMLAIGALLGLRALSLMLILLAVLNNLTVFQRIYVIWKKTQGTEEMLNIDIQQVVNGHQQDN